MPIRLLRFVFVLLATLLVVPIVDGRPVDGASRTVTLAAVGDVLFARGVAKEIKKHGVDYLFEPTSDILTSCDLAFCNLECVLSTRGTPIPNQRFLFRADPSDAHALSSAGFDIVSVANNHTMDFGRDALTDTIDALNSNGMIPVGARIVGSDDSGVRYIDKNDLRIGFLALSDFDPGGRQPVLPAGQNRCLSPVGLSVMQVDMDLLPEQIADAKLNCDTLVVSLHWGIDYMGVPTHRQIAIAHLCIDNGADLVLGHHPHVLQRTEIYKGKPIVYSMGGFVWDSSFRGSDRSAIYVFDLSSNSAVLKESIPVEKKGDRFILFNK